MLLIHAVVTVTGVWSDILSLCGSTGGDISTKNLWLAESVLDILLEQKYVCVCVCVTVCGDCAWLTVVCLREWVLKSGMLIAMSVYTYLRLIVDHGAPNLLPLRQKEVDFCISMLREKVRGRADAGGGAVLS